MVREKQDRASRVVSAAGTNQANEPILCRSIICSAKSGRNENDTCAATTGQEPVGSMGIDIPLAVLSDKPQLFFNYFEQLFAQVTNRPIDPYKESLVMSLMTWIGKKGNFLEELQTRRQLKLPDPILSIKDLEIIKMSQNEHLKVAALSYCFLPTATERTLKKRLIISALRLREKVKEGNTMMILH